MEPESVVLAAMNAGNLMKVAQQVRDKRPRAKIVIAGDDDRFTEGNPGRTKAIEAAIAVGGEYALPVFPVFNAPLDWLSLGVTRGLLLHIGNGRHNSVSAFGWALMDIALALAFLLAVAGSSFMAYWLARLISPESVSSLAELRDVIAGGDQLSIGIWLMLASTLVPTFLHFLVALFAFVSQPFSREKAENTANKLQVARDEALRRVREDTNQSANDVPVNAYAKRWAMMFFGVSWPIVFVLWLAIVSFLAYVIYGVMQWMFLALLPAAAG